MRTGLRLPAMVCSAIAVAMIVPGTAYAGGPPVPGSAAPVVPDGAGMYGVWTTPADPSGTDAIAWYLQTPVAPRGGLYDVIFYSNASSGQQFDCSRLAVQEGSLDTDHTFHLRGTVTGRAVRSCGGGAFAVRLSPVPAGLVARVVVPTSITASQDTYDALGVIAMAGRSDLHLRASALVVAQPGTSSPTSASTSAAPSSSSSGRTSTSTPTSTSATPSVPSVPSGVPLEAADHRVTDHFGAVGSTVLAGSVALGVLIAGAGISASSRRRR